MYVLQNMSSHVPDRVDVVAPYDPKVREEVLVYVPIPLTVDISAIAGDSKSRA